MGRTPSGIAATAVALIAAVVVVSLGAAAMGLTGPSAVSEAIPFAPNVRVTDRSSPLPHQVEPYLVVDPLGRLIIGWKEALTADGPGFWVGFAHSEDGGRTWSPNTVMALANPGRHQSDPWLTVDERNRTYYARLEYSGDESTVSVSRSDDGGRAWGPISSADDRPGFADKESIASDGAGSLYVVYDDVVGNDTDVRFTRSPDAGASWSPTVSVTDAVGAALGPVVASSGDGNSYVAWWNLTDGNIMVDRSGDRGTTWGTDIRVNSIAGSVRSDSGNPAFPSLPSIAIDSQGRVFVAWADRGGGDLNIVVARSDDGGRTWTRPARVNDDLSGREQWMPALAVDRSNRIHAAWMDNRTGNLNVFYANSTDGGDTWSPNVRVTTAETPSSFHRPGDYLGFAVDANGTVYLAWTDGREGNLDIYFARDPGASVATTTPPAQSSLDAVGIAILVVGTAVPAVALALLLRRGRRPPETPGGRPPG